jgi:hypothetical protein
MMLRHTQQSWGGVAKALQPPVRKDFDRDEER